MRIVIVGAGLVGSTLARHLAKGGYDVAIVDNDLTQLTELSEKLDILTVHGNGVNPSILETAGIKDADLLIAATPSDELNIVVCAIGQIHSVPKRFARIRNDELATQVSSENLQKLGVTRVIQPETAVVERILQYIDTPGVKDAANFHDDSLLLRGIEITDSMPICGISLAKMRDSLSNGTLLIVAVIREGIGIIPMGDFILLAGDIAYVMYETHSQEAFFRLSGLNNNSISKIVISGDSLIARKLCNELEERHIEQIIWLIQDEDFAYKMEGQLSNVEVLNGSATDVDVLREIQVNNADFYISVGDETEDNIMSALLAKSIGASETLSISNEDRLNELFKSIGVSHVISPRLVTAQQIMHEIRRSHFGLILRLGNTDLDVIHLTVGENSKTLDLPIMDVWKMVKAKFLIATIIRDDEIFIPQGKSRIQAGDEMILISKSKNRSVLKRLFKAQ